MNQKFWLSILIVAHVLLLSFSKDASAGVEPANEPRKFGITALVGLTVAGAPRPTAFDDFAKQYGEFNHQLSAAAFLELEGFLTQKLSLYGEGGTLAYWGKGPAVLFEGHGEPLVRQRHFPITFNVRYGFNPDGFVPFLNAGLGIAPGQWSWNLTDDSLFGFVLQVGGGLRKFFSRKFGLGLEMKYQYIINTKSIAAGEGDMLSASEANVGTLSLLLGLYF